MEGPSSQQLSALAIVLDMPELAADPLLLCSAAKVCSSWRAAVADSGAGTTNVLLHCDECLSNCSMVSDRSFSKLFSLAAWLCKHSHLVCSLKLYGFVSASPEAANSVCQLLSMAWQLAAAGPRPLHLQRFESDITVSAATRCMLNVLPGSLIELDVFAQDCLSCREVNWGVVDGVLARLMSLETLSICSQPSPIFGSAGCEMHPDTLAGLTGLTRLDLAADIPEDMLELCVSRVLGLHGLQQLCLVLRAGLWSPQALTGVDFSGMAALTQLHLELSDIALTGQGTVLPPKLQELSLCLKRLSRGTRPIDDLDLSNLDEPLRVLRLVVGQAPLSDLGFNELSPIPVLSNLQSLELSYFDFSSARADWARWSSLPNITAMCIIDEDPEGWEVHEGLQDLYLDALADLQGLARLQLFLVSESDAESPACVCGQLSRLKHLQHLELCHVRGDEVEDLDCRKLWPGPAHMLHQLTCLNLRGTGRAVGDTVAVALATNMPRLQALDLTSCSISSIAALPAIARLQHLTRLALSQNCLDEDNALELYATWIQQFRDAGWPKLGVKW